MLVRYSADGTLRYDKDTILCNVGKVTSIAPSTTQNTSTLTDGNSDWDMHFDTTKAGQLTVTMATFQPELYAALMGVEAEETKGDTFWVADEGHVVDDDGEIKLDHVPAEDGVMVVKFEDGSEPSGTITPSQTLSIGEGDAGKTVFVTYEAETEGGIEFGLPESGSRPALHAIITGEAESDDGAAVYDVNILIDKCKATGDVASPTMQREAQNWSFTLQVLQPRPGKRAVGYKFLPRTVGSGVTGDMYSF